MTLLLTMEVKRELKLLAVLNSTVGDSDVIEDSHYQRDSLAHVRGTTLLIKTT